MVFFILKAASFIGLLIVVALIVLHLAPWILGALVAAVVFKLLCVLRRRSYESRQLPPARWPWKE